MIYAGQIQNQQYAQYANRTIGHKQDYAGTEKISYVPFQRVYKELEKQQENQTAAERKVNEMKRKRSLYKDDIKFHKGYFINEYR
ncbi:hypothetical protein WKH37_12930 [Bacillus subtilis]|uniref:hypothetical protein n=1 Tax=Bacillus TaxID=1386 RepID=UPI000F54878E|nr:hypothetical protein [Bacillus subtilis]WJD93684.1 hypothetical protein QR321_06395 [Bacillus spizizenii]MCP6732467.1 hypothetical protein [Bacillus subtilis]MEC1364096.1 hypothetical protein [Bacillus subtilis]MEC1381020.1 hypothetical protein [Bacillus subtilis]MED1819947.1 hypothetical protein [Bacillus subtilis]